MTVDELMEELIKYNPSDEVLVCDTPTTAHRLLGVYSRSGKVYLDPAANPDEVLEGFHKV